jgi:hypothetical protein
VPRGSSFAEFLDQALTAGPTLKPEIAEPAPTSSAREPHVVAADAIRAPRPKTYGATPFALPGSRGRRPASRSRCAARRLDPSDRHALDTFRDLGADLGIDFTVEELRRAFRQLAQAYHPDRHPDAGMLEVRQYSAAFSSLNASYRRLQILAADDPDEPTSH